MTPATEQGFGSGLRAHVNRKRGGDETPPEEEQPRSVSEAVALAEPPPSNAGADQLRAELEASLDRERALRDSLNSQDAANERELQIQQEAARRAEELDERVAQLAAAEADRRRP